MTILNGTEGRDQLNGGPEGDILNGLGGSDQLRGGLGFDRLNGGDGDDWMASYSAHGPDALDGGAGIDTALIERIGYATGLTFAIEDPSVLQTLEDGTTIVDVERIHFIGGNGADHITGGALDDRLSGGSGANILNGGGGADRLFTYSGDDFLDGGDGIDTIVIFRRSDSAPVAFVMEAPENATILPSGATIQNIERLEYIGGLGDDHLTGGRFDDLLVGNEGDDVLIGGDGDDFLTGGTGADILDGGAGIDTATIGGGNFDLTEPIVEYELADGTILRGIEAINYSGGQGNDHIIGGAFADTFKWWRR